MHSCVTKALAAVAVAAISFMPVAPVFGADQDDFPTRTPIKHVVVIFQENRSFDHYFGTYPHAKANKDGTKFFGGAKDGTPRVNNLESAGLLTNNPNKVNPFRIDHSTPNSCDENHGYSAEQAAFHDGLMDMFVQQTELRSALRDKRQLLRHHFWTLNPGTLESSCRQHL